jgi:diguanylate cyclase (GGDEF)-like protein
LLVGVLLGLLLWGGLEGLQSRHLQGILFAELQSDVGEQAGVNRARLHATVQRGALILKLLVQQHSVTTHLAGLLANNDLRLRRSTGTWLPPRANWQGLIEPSAFLVFDASGQLRELAQLGSAALPQRLLAEAHHYRHRSLGTALRTAVEGVPLVLSTEAVVNSEGRILGYLGMATILDERYLAFVMGGQRFDRHLVLLRGGAGELQVYASVHPDVVPNGTSLSDVEQHYLVAGRAALDWGDTDLNLQLATLIPRSAVAQLNRGILGLSREQRLVAAAIFIVSFSALIFVSARRIERLRRHVEYFITEELNGLPQRMVQGDQITLLAERFHDLVRGVHLGRQAMRRNFEMQARLEQLDTLQAVTDRLGVGVIAYKEGQPAPVNDAMRAFAEQCGGVAAFDSRAEDQCRLELGHDQQRRVFELRRLDVHSGEDVVLVQDVTEIERQRRELEHQALHDALTQLPNRSLLTDRLDQALRSAQRSRRPVSLALMDLDRFKEVNDTLGHQAGDIVLKEVVARLSACVREEDTLARLGGDEFALVLLDCNTRGALQVCEAIVSALQEPLRLQDQKIDLDISIGLVEFPRDGEDAETLLRRADVAMYHGKRSHDSICVFNPELDAYSRERLALMAELREALRTGKGLELHLQPQVRLEDGQVVAFEGLLRWHHPQRGMIAPGEFIPMAEQSPLISDLTRWVIDRALSGIARWRRLQPQLRVAVNLSARNLGDPGLVAFIVDRLGEHRLPADALVLEVTESAIMWDPQRARAILDSLHAMGVSISVDDFGTGYSSLAYLSQLPVSELKIDRSFVQGMLSNAGDLAIVHATVDLGHDLGLKVVAEGVEVTAELNALRSMGCDLIQGFLFGKPLSEAALEELLASGGPLRKVG